MRHPTNIRRACSYLSLSLFLRWQRWQCLLAALYFRRVAAPVQFWVALGRPVQFRPHLPWWQPFLFAWLRGTGWLPAARRPRR